MDSASDMGVMKRLCNVCYCCISGSGKIKGVNQKFLKVFGLTERRIIGKDFSVLVSRDKAGFQRQLKERCRMERFSDLEAELGSGKNRSWFRISGTSEGGEVHCLLQDVTSEKVRMSSMMNQDGLYSALVETCQVGMIIVNDNSIIFINDEILKVGGFRRSELIRKPISLLFPKSRIIEGIKKADKKPRSLEAELKSKGGALVRCSITLREIRFDGKQAKLIMVSDLTDITSAKEEQKVSEERFRTLANQTPNMIFINAGGRIVYVNDLAVSMMGYSRKEYYGKSFDFMKLIAPEHHNMIIQNFRKHSTGEEVEPYEYKIVAKDGTIIDAFITTKLIQYGGSPAILGIVTDISELKQSQRELERREKLMRSLFDNVTSGFALHDIVIDGKGKPIDYIYRDVNRAFERITGLKRKDIIGKAVRKIIPGIENDPADWINFFGKVALSGNPSSTTNFSKALDRWFSVKSFSIKKGEFVAVFDDVTEQREAILALEESEDKYRSLAEQSSDGIILADYSGSIFTWNRAMEDITRIKAKNAIGKKVWDIQFLFAHPSHQTKKNRLMLEDKFKNFISGDGSKDNGDVHEIEAYINGKERKIIEEKAFLIKSKKSRLFGGILKDVTERSEALKALRESEEKYRLIVENQSDLVVKVDTEGVFKFISPSYCRMFGKKDKDLIGTNFMPLVHPDDRAHTENAMKSLTRPPFSAYLEQRAMTKKGWRWLAWVDTGITDESGKVVEIIGVGRDITDKKLAELEKVQLEKKLKRYARQLELKVNKLEKTQFVLTEKEKRVLTGFAGYPLEGDESIGKRVNINRSTVTAIKNRLFKRGLFSSANIPGPKCFDFNLLTLVSGTFSRKAQRSELKAWLSHIGFVFEVASDSQFFGFILSRDLVDLHETLPLLGEGPKGAPIEGDPMVLSLPLGLLEFRRLFDFAPMIKEFYGVDLGLSKTFPSCTPGLKVTRNMQEILYTSMRFPDEKTIDIAKRLRLSRNTVAKIRHSLVEGGHLHRRIIPDLKKLGFGMVSLAVGKPENVSDALLPQTLLLVSGPRDVIRVDIFKGFNDRTEAYKGLGTKGKHLVKFDFDIRSAHFNLDYSPAIARLFGIKEKEY